jgi:c(7)-type cytochrome triheme protein
MGWSNLLAFFIIFGFTLFGCAEKNVVKQETIRMIQSSSMIEESSTIDILPTPKEDISPEKAIEEILSAKEKHPLAFYFLPKTQGGEVDWVTALTDGFIKPRESIDLSRKNLPSMDFNVVFKVKGDLPDVVYPHFPHTLWLDCKNCHPSIFVMQAGINPVTMTNIEEGEFCGRCHGKVAFPLSECNRCHTLPK